MGDYQFKGNQIQSCQILAVNGRTRFPSTATILDRVKIMADLDIRDIMERCDIYVLDLGAFYYVGRTNNPKQRMMAHIAGTASNFTRQHKPIKIHRYYRNATPGREQSVACLMIKEKGAYRVRGG